MPLLLYNCFHNAVCVCHLPQNRQTSIVQHSDVVTNTFACRFAVSNQPVDSRRQGMGLRGSFHCTGQPKQGLNPGACITGVQASNARHTTRCPAAHMQPP